MDSLIFTPLRYIPIQHTCGHFEARLTRWYRPERRELGFETAGNDCARCSPPDGRGDNPNYPDLAVVQAACLEKNAARGVVDD